MVYARFGSTAVFDVNRRDVRFLGRSGRRLVETDNRPVKPHCYGPVVRRVSGTGALMLRA